MDTNQNNLTTGFLPICPFESDHPDMLIAVPQRDKRLDVITQCEYSQNTETYD